MDALYASWSELAERGDSLANELLERIRHWIQLHSGRVNFDHSPRPGIEPGAVPLHVISEQDQVLKLGREFAVDLFGRYQAAVQCVLRRANFPAPDPLENWRYSSGTPGNCAEMCAVSLGLCDVSEASTGLVVRADTKSSNIFQNFGSDLPGWAHNARVGRVSLPLLSNA